MIKGTFSYILFLGVLMISFNTSFGQAERTGGTPNIVSTEYWFDDNIDSRTIIATPQNANLSVIESISVTGLSYGLHSINFRFKDEAAKWSSVLTQMFFKKFTGQSLLININAYEYWFDEDIDNSTFIMVNDDELLDLNSAIDISTLSPGSHTVNFRFQDDLNNWSSVLTQIFLKIGHTNSATGYVTAYRYWFDSDLMTVENVELAEPINPLSAGLQIDVIDLTEGEHTVHISFRDSMSIWSSAITDTFERGPVLIVGFESSDTIICIGESIQFTNTSINGHTYFWDFGDGNSSSEENPNYTYTMTGTYTVTFSISDTINSIIESVTIINHILVLESQETTVNVTSCDPADTGMVVIVLTDENGCDSVVTTITSLIESYETTIDRASCDPDEVGTTMDTMTSTEGCDSILTTITTLLSSYEIIVTQTSCNPLDTGTVVQDLTASNGCDSIVTTITSWSPSYEITLDEEICEDESFEVGGDSFTESGSYVIELVTIDGCDSIITLNLTMIENLDGGVVFMPPLLDSVCLSGPVINLLPLGSPVGGIFSGSGVIGNGFDPQLAGPGIHTLFYSYNYGSDCEEMDSTTIMVDACPGINLAIYVGFVQVYPNPFAVSTRLKYQLIEPADVTIELFNLVGKNYGMLLDAHQDVGIHEVEVSGHQLSQGLYYLKISSNDWEIYRSIVVQW